MNPTREQIEEFIRTAAPEYHLDPELIIRQCEAESSFKQDAVSPCGAIGLAQLMPETAKGLKVDPREWRANLSGGLHYLAQMRTRFGTIDKALAAYNCGPGRLAGILSMHGAEWGDDWRSYLPTETKNYLKKILV